MRRWEWVGNRWVFRLPPVPAWCHWAALVSGLFTYGFGWLAWLFFCACYLILRSRWTEIDTRGTEEIYAAELGGSRAHPYP